MTLPGRFERTNVWMSAATGNMSEDQAAVFVPRTNPGGRNTSIENCAMRIFQSSLSESRQAADDAEACFQFGLARKLNCH